MTVRADVGRYRPRKIEAELSQMHAIDEYNNSLAEWEDVSVAFSKAVDAVCVSMADLAAAAVKVERKRRALLTEHERLKAHGAHVQPPKVGSKDARMVLDAARNGPKGAVAVIGVVAKGRA